MTTMTQTASTRTATFADERRRLWAELKGLYRAHGYADHFACVQRLDDGFFAQHQHQAALRRAVARQDEANRRDEREFEFRFPEEAQRRREAMEVSRRAREAKAAVERRAWEAEEERRRQREQLPLEQRLAELEERERLRERDEADLHRRQIGG